MKRYFLIALCALSAIVSACQKEDPIVFEKKKAADETPDTTHTDPIGPVTKQIIVGYATYWDTVMPDPTLLTHINYAFAHIKSDFETLDIKTVSRLKKIAGLKSRNPDLKVLLSVGGWGAGNFSEMAADDTHRKNFCNNCLAAIKQYNLDGIDLDWEYPTSSSAGISSSSSDTKNFTKLCKELRETLGEDLLLTMASSSSAKYVDFKSCIQYLDFVNLMTYDMGEPPSSHNAGLYKSSLTYRSCEESIQLHKSKGVPIEKMTMGVPYFGHWDDKISSDGVYYCRMKWDETKYTEKWDDTAKVPYLVDNSGTMVFSFDNEKSIALKADYVKKMKLLGIMYWNIEGDDKNWTLSKAIASRILTPSE